RDPRRARRRQGAKAGPTGRSSDQLPAGRPDHSQEDGRAQLRLSLAVDRRGGGAMIGLVIGVIIAILLVGVILKVLKLAIILAVCVGIVLFAQDKLGTKRIK